MELEFILIKKNLLTNFNNKGKLALIKIIIAVRILFPKRVNSFFIPMDYWFFPRNC